MRAALILATIAALALVAFLVVDHFAPHQSSPPPTPGSSAPPRVVAVLCGQRGDLEILLRPFYLDESRDEFNSTLWSKHLGTGSRYRYAMLWAVNHGSEAARLPGLGEARLLSETQADWDSADISSLLSQAPARLPAFFRRQVEAWSVRDRKLEPGSMIRLAVVLPAGARFDELQSLRFGRDGLDLALNWAYGEDIENYDLRPKGRLTRLLRPNPGEEQVEPLPNRDGN